MLRSENGLFFVYSGANFAWDVEALKGKEWPYQKRGVIRKLRKPPFHVLSGANFDLWLSKNSIVYCLKSGCRATAHNLPLGSGECGRWTAGRSACPSPEREKSPAGMFRLFSKGVAFHHLLHRKNDDGVALHHLAGCIVFTLNLIAFHDAFHVFQGVVGLARCRKGTGGATAPNRTTTAKLVIL